MLKQIYGMPLETDFPAVKRTNNGGRALKTPLAVFFEDVLALRLLGTNDYLVLYAEQDEEGAHTAERVTITDEHVIVEPIEGEYVFKQFYPNECTLVAVPENYSDILYSNSRMIIFRIPGYGLQACVSNRNFMDDFMPLHSRYTKRLPKRVIKALQDYYNEESFCVRYDSNGRRYYYVFTRSDLEKLHGKSGILEPDCPVHFYRDEIAYDGPFTLNFAMHRC